MQQRMLERLGLTKHEAKIYLALLELGSTNAGPIIAKTKLHRQIVYSALENLIDKGLVTFVVEKNRRYFQATEPEQFKEWFKEEEKEIDVRRKEFERLLPELLAKKPVKGKEQEVCIYRGNKGLKTVLDYILKATKKEINILAVSYRKVGPGLDKYYKYYFPKFLKGLANKKIKIRFIFPEGTRKIRGEIVAKLPFVQVKYIPDEYATPIGIQIYSGHVSLMAFQPIPLAIRISSKEVFDAMRSYFEALWRTAVN